MPDMPEKTDFESTLKQLEDIVQTLEQGDLGLEEALNRFEQGMRLSRQCQQALDEAQLRVSRLMAEVSATAPGHEGSEGGGDDDVPF